MNPLLLLNDIIERKNDETLLEYFHKNDPIKVLKSNGMDPCCNFKDPKNIDVKYLEAFNINYEMERINYLVRFKHTLKIQCKSSNILEIPHSVSLGLYRVQCLDSNIFEGYKDFHLNIDKEGYFDKNDKNMPFYRNLSKYDGKETNYDKALKDFHVKPYVNMNRLLQALLHGNFEANKEYTIVLKTYNLLDIAHAMFAFSENL
jgi:hypothetical protein